MRRGFNNLAIYKDDKGNLQGVGLGSDFCAEHERGIDGIRSKFGMDKNILGIGRYTITKGKVVSFEYVHEKVKWYGLTSHDAYMWDKKPYDMKEIAKWALEYVDSKKDIQGAWADEDFLFIVKERTLRDTIAEAFAQKNIVIMRGGCGLFNNGSLNILLLSQFPIGAMEDILKTHISQQKLENAVKVTGIKEKLAAAGKKYFALSPEWKNKEETEFHFWLDPQEQDKNNYGWYEIKDLEDWINNIGRIPN